ncbi:MAG: hypothetical protein WEA29_07280 [Acidimicrobiia bacterium]
MTTEHEGVLQRVRPWFDANPDVRSIADGEITVVGDRPVGIDVAESDGDLLLTHRMIEPEAPADRVDGIVAALAEPVPGVATDVRFEDGVLTATLTARIAADRLSKHSVLGGVYAIAGLAETALAPSPATTADAPAVAVPEAGASPFAPPVSQFDTDAADPDATQVVDDEPEPEAEHTRVLERVWAPTHVVPRGGLPAWPRPDGRAPADVHLEPRVELVVAETRGDWARVVGDNGWSGWVDNRRLVMLDRRGATPAASRVSDERTPSTLRRFVLPLLGILSIGAAVALPWLRDGGGDLDAFEIPFAFLWDVATAAQPAIAWVLLGAAALAAALIALPRARLAHLPLGLAILAMPIFFVSQVYQGIGGSVSDTISLIGLGPTAALLAGVFLLASARR